MGLCLGRSAPWETMGIHRRRKEVVDGLGWADHAAGSQQAMLLLLWCCQRGLHLLLTGVSFAGILSLLPDDTGLPAEFSIGCCCRTSAQGVRVALLLSEQSPCCHVAVCTWVMWVEIAVQCSAVQIAVLRNVLGFGSTM